MRIEQFFRKYARGRGVTIAEQLAVRVRRKLSVRAPTRTTKSGRLVATTRATPSAPPRLVTGDLRGSVRVVRTSRGARLVVWKPYGAFLEDDDHKFVQPAMEEMGLV